MSTVLCGVAMSVVVGIEVVLIGNMFKNYYNDRIAMLNKKIHKLELNSRKANASAKHYKQLKEYYEEQSIQYQQALYAEKGKVKVDYRYADSFRDKDLIPKETLKEAFKKLMVYSHPDKGNCKDSSDFVKYKKIYDGIK